MATIYIYIVAIFLAIGCAKESLSPDQNDAILALSHIDNPEGPDPDPEVDCKCYMRVIGVHESMGTSDWWKLFAGGELLAEGFGPWWFEPGSPTGMPLPSTFVELPPPSNGWHSFTLEFLGGAPTYGLLYTEVRCYLQNGDGTETLMTTTYHTFDFWEGSPVPALEDQARRFSKFFSCLVQTEDPPKDSGSAG